MVGCVSRACRCTSHAWQSFFGFGQSAEVFIKLNETDSRKKVEVKGEGDQKHKLSVYYDGESITGEVCLLRRGALDEHGVLHTAVALAPLALAILMLTDFCFSLLQVQIKLKQPNKKFEHQGIKVEFIGSVGE